MRKMPWPRSARTGRQQVNVPLLRCATHAAEAQVLRSTSFVRHHNRQPRSYEMLCLLQRDLNETIGLTVSRRKWLAISNIRVLFDSFRKRCWVAVVRRAAFATIRCIPHCRRAGFHNPSPIPHHFDQLHALSSLRPALAGSSWSRPVTVDGKSRRGQESLLVSRLHNTKHGGSARRID